MKSPMIERMDVIPVAGYDSMLMTLSGAHAPCFTRNLVILTDSAGHQGIGEIHGGDYTHDGLVAMKPLVEGMPVVADPGIISPGEFLDEVVKVRMPNPYLGDTSQRIAVDISQMVGIRFGETVKSYVAKEGSAKNLIGIPLAIAGWIRYLLALDDEGNAFELAPDPMIPELQEQLKDLQLGNPDSVKEALRPILSNANIFGSDLYEAGIGDTVETMVKEMLAGKGAVRKTLKKYLD